jgi:HPt (histidine-containing phosphotransfer) domain-containing protein
MDKILNQNTVAELRALANDTATFKAIFISMEEDGKKLVDNIKHYALRNDWDKLQQTVHTLKGVAATVGAISLAEICKNTERTIANGMYEQIKTDIIQIETAYNHLSAFIDSHIINAD